jgi:maltose alpha-D-glucosyltransferase / alpha-amylase
LVPDPPQFAIPAENITEILAGPGLALLEESILPKYICQQRWFGSKTRTVRKVTVADWAPLPVPDSALTILKVTYNEDTEENYVLALAITSDPYEGRERSVLTNVGRSRSSLAKLVDGFSIDDVRASVLAVIRDRESLQAFRGEFVGLPGSYLKNLATPTASRVSSAEQSNTSVFFDDTLILKLFRRVETGINPDVEIGKVLTEEVHFEHTPPFAGELTYRAAGEDGDGDAEYVIALLQGQVTNEGDGWSWTLSRLQHSLDLHSDEDRVLSFLDAAQLLGQRTAEMHAALELASGQDFSSETATDANIQADVNRLKNQLDKTLTLIRTKFAELPDENIEAAALLISKKSYLEIEVDRLRSIPPDRAGRWSRIHGDFHLGQVLRTNTDFVILDFEGEPAKTLDQRRAKQSPLRDVAGMLRSFSYVIAAFEKLHPGLSWSRDWERSVSDRYLESYISSRPIGEDRSVSLLLKAYTLEKALYELQYELNHRPDWISIPLKGILGLITD